MSVKILPSPPEGAKLPLNSTGFSSPPTFSTSTQSSPSTTPVTFIAASAGKDIKARKVSYSDKAASPDQCTVNLLPPLKVRESHKRTTSPSLMEICSSLQRYLSKAG